MKRWLYCLPLLAVAALLFGLAASGQGGLSVPSLRLYDLANGTVRADTESARLYYNAGDLILEDPDGGTTTIGAAGGGASWGSISGTLSNQTDLNSALGAKVDAGAVTNGDLTMATARLLGRTTAGTGAIQEITVGSGLSLSAGALTATGGSGSVGLLHVPFHSDGGSNVALTNQPNGVDFFPLGSQRGIVNVDLTDYSEYRLYARVVTASASANTPRLFARYGATFITNPVNYLVLGTGSDVNVSLSAGGGITTAWTPLAAGAQGDVFLAVFEDGGDGTADPTIGYLALQFR